MLNFLASIDRTIMDILEIQTHKFQRWTGLTNFWLWGKVNTLLAICYGLVIVACITAPNTDSTYPTNFMQALGFFQMTTKPQSWEYYLFGLVFFFYFWQGNRWQEKERIALDDIKDGAAPILRAGIPFFTIYFVFLVIQSLITIVVLREFPTILFLLIFWAYLDRLMPLPPTKSKIREFIEALSARQIESQVRSD
jgi:hypothetical protein